MSRNAGRDGTAGSRLLLSLSGAQPRILAMVPSERPRYYALATSTLVSSVISAAAMVFAVQQLADAGLLAALIAGLLWGAVVLNLNRYLSMALGHTRRWRSLLIIIPRLLLSAVIALLVSVPLVLHVFKSDIDAQLLELRLQQNEQLVTAVQNSALGRQIVADQQQVSHLQATINALTAAGKTAHAQQIKAEAAALAEAQSQLNSAYQRQQEQLSSIETLSARATGLLAQLQALSEASSVSAALSLTRWLLYALFFLIDFLPVLTASLLQLGPRTLYDEVLADEARVEAAFARHDADLRLRAMMEEQEAWQQSRAKGSDELWRRNPDFNNQPTGPLASFKELTVPHADGELRRMEISEKEFVLLDVLDGNQTLNWTSSIGAREFTYLVRVYLERLEARGERKPGEIMITMDGVSDHFDARLGAQFAAASSPAFNERTEFVRYDDSDLTMALETLHDDGGEYTRMFGVSASRLSLGTVAWLMASTATKLLAAHAQSPAGSALMKRIEDLAHLAASGRRALPQGATEREEGQGERRKMP